MASTVAAGFLQKIVAESQGPSAQQSPTYPPELEWLLSLIDAYYTVFVVLMGIQVVAVLGVIAGYWTCWIKPTEEKKLSPSSILPQSLLGGWQYGWCGCLEDCKLCCFAYCCPMCTEAETWYRAGWSQAITGSRESCGQYYGGLCALFCLTGIPCVNCCMLCGCIRGALRGGASQSPAGICGAIPHDLRFGMQGNYLVNCLQTFWCFMLCSVCQEYRQIRAAVEHPETIHEQVPQMQMMMANPGPQMVPGGQPMMPPPMMPQGQMAPQGQMMAPQGQMMAPPGQMM